MGYLIWDARKNNYSATESSGDQISNTPLESLTNGYLLSQSDLAPKVGVPSILLVYFVIHLAVVIVYIYVSDYYFLWYDYKSNYI